MPRTELHSETLPNVEQRAPIKDNTNDYAGDVITGEQIKASADAGYLDELAFMEDPIKIRIEPSSDKNASNVFPVWVNGKPAEVLVGGRWLEMGYLPVAQEMTVKRKVVEVIVRAKTDTIQCEMPNMFADRPENRISRYTSPLTGFSVLHDPNPRGGAWLSEMRRRNF